MEKAKHCQTIPPSHEICCNKNGDLYGTENCFEYQKGNRIKLKRISRSQNKEILLAVFNPDREDETMAISLPQQVCEALGSWLVRTEQVQIGIDVANEIISRMAMKYKVRVCDMKNTKLKGRAALARREAMYYIRTKTKLSSVKIGKIFGANHATVLLACKQHKREMAG